jgi:hypothetical protein
LGEKGLLDLGGGGGLFLTFGFKYTFFRFSVVGFRRFRVCGFFF